MLSRSRGGLKVKPKNTFLPPSGCFIVNISFTRIKRCFDNCYYRMFRLNIKLFPLYNCSHISFFANFLDVLSIIANVCVPVKKFVCVLGVKLRKPLHQLKLLLRQSYPTAGGAAQIFLTENLSTLRVGSLRLRLRSRLRRRQSPPT